ncbi:MAG TPA: hypothetical protein VGS07_05170 [Thermoanaerobaculia bacterium]|jgi:hypothetical protein|nr:hypothetical protein [Thermoanaerobaculia bacterium]
MSKPTAPEMTAPASGVKVRMYRQGQGDCFLLAFPTRQGERPCYMLIDCGALLGTEGAAAKMKKVAASVTEATGGKIDVLVATRDHWDHVSGFQQAKEVFEGIEIGQVWTAWTEDPNDPAAQRLRSRREIALRALHAAAQELRQCGEEDSAGSLESVLGIFGEIGKDGHPAAIQQTMAHVLGRGNPPRYLRSGDRPELPGVDGAHVYVLGPPGVAPRRPLAPAPAAAADGGSVPGPRETELKTLSFPFDPYFRVPVDAARQDSFFQASYFGIAGQPGEHEMAWRQIETEWLTTASRLTLQLDSNANNTSLALSIELAPSGKMLLFAADAQTDHWLTGHHADSGVPLQSPRLSPEEWKDFEKRCTLTQDYVELAIAGPASQPRGKKK